MDFFCEITSGLSPYSALSLVRQRIHAVRQSTRLSEIISHYFSWFLGDDIWKRSRIQRMLVQHWIHVYVSL